MSKIFRFYFLVLIVIPLYSNLFSQLRYDPADILPEEIDGWLRSEDRVFDEDNLYDYIDGGAELFLSFGYVKTFNRIYTKESSGEIIVDIFYMNNSWDSYGVFTFSVGETGNDFGVQSQMAPGAIIFWKAGYYVSIFASPVSEDAEDVSAKLAAIIDDSIPRSGDLPHVLDYLPEQSLDKNSIRYFRHYIWQNSHFYLSGENILNINDGTHAVLARYAGDYNAVLLIIDYPGEESAEEAKEKFIENFDKGLECSPVVELENGKWCGIKRYDDILMGVFESNTGETVSALIELTESQIEMKN